MKNKFSEKRFITKSYSNGDTPLTGTLFDVPTLQEPM